MNNDSAVLPVSVFNDGHYATLVKTRRVLEDAQTSAAQHGAPMSIINGREERRFQHFRVRVHGDAQASAAQPGAPMSIIHCHAPAANLIPGHGHLSDDRYELAKTHRQEIQTHGFHIFLMLEVL